MKLTGVNFTIYPNKITLHIMDALNKWDVNIIMTSI